MRTVGPTDSRQVVNSLLQLMNVEVPAHLLQESPKRDGTEFDPASVFGVLTELAMDRGWTADYDYKFNGLGGSPMVYARGPAGEKGALLDHVKANETTVGYFQLALLTIMHDQFYLYRQAGRKRVRPIVSATDLERLPEKVKTRLSEQDIRPNVVYPLNALVVANICVFSMWDGAVRIPIQMVRSFPHHPTPSERILLAPNDSGIRF